MGSLSPTNESRSVTACIVNFDGSRNLDATLSAVFEQGEAIGEVLLVDNASMDDSVALVRERFPDVRILELPVNHGPGAARNAGYQAAKHDRILFVDDDVVLATGCADALRTALDADAEAVAAMPRVLYANAPNVIQFDGADSHYLGVMLLRNSGVPLEEALDTPGRMGSIVTACILMDRTRWGRDDPFDERFFFNYEDHDFGMRARGRGHALLSVPSAHCLHGEGTPGLSHRPGGEYASGRVLCLIRNRWWILLTNYELRSLFVFSPMLLVFEICQLAEVVVEGWLSQWAEAVRGTLRHADAIRAKRRHVQATRRVGDAQVLCDAPLGFGDELLRSEIERLARRLLDGAARGYWTLARRLLERA